MSPSYARAASCAHASCTRAVYGARACASSTMHRLRSLPQVQPGEEALRGASRRAYKRALRDASGGKKKGPRPKPKPADAAAAHRVELFVQELVSPLRKTLRAFPEPARMHPFERNMLELSLLASAQNAATSGQSRRDTAEGGEARYLRALDDCERARKKVHAAGREATSSVRNMLRPGGRALASSVRGWSGMSWKEREDEAVRRTQEELGRTWSSVTTPALDSLLTVVRVLRRLPEVDVDACTIALVGAPNVGKSSLVRLLSSGRPEVREYPFTTKGIVVGHFEVPDSDHGRCQVTDTPGLLPRTDVAERNAMEMLTLASLRHLPTSVLFVIDPTGECGTSAEDQLSIREQLRADFPDKPWLDVLSKADLVRELEGDADVVSEGASGHVVGLTPLAAEMTAMASAACPDALRVSAVTNEGIDVLREEIGKRLVTSIADVSEAHELSE